MTQTITTHEAKTHLSRYLAEVERGREYVIAGGKKAVAKLVPIEPPKTKRRPNVGDTIDKQYHIPDSAFAPLTDKELKEEWGL